MADTTHHISDDVLTDQALRRDILISQIIDGEGDGSAWTEFGKLAATDAGAWRELALAQRDQAALAHAVNLEIACADDAELPAPGSDRLLEPQTIGVRLTRWSGWGVAAAVAMTWLGTQFAAVYDSRTRSDASQAAGFVPAGSYQIDTPQEALSAYQQLGRQSGTVLGELPDRVIVESRPLGGGRGFEVVYLRQFMERAQVAELYELNRDDSGQRPMLLPVAQPSVKRQNNRID